MHTEQRGCIQRVGAVAGHEERFFVCSTERLSLFVHGLVETFHSIAIKFGTRALRAQDVVALDTAGRG